jgi:MFS family permease
MPRALLARRLVFTLLFVELLDELIDGALDAALPSIRTDLGLSYAQIGALFTVPALLGNLIEVPFGLLADRGHRRRLVVVGGSIFTVAILAMAGAQSYVVLLPEQKTAHRQILIRQLKERGIETTIGTWHMPMTTYFHKRYSYKAGDFPVTDGVFARAMTLPLYEELSARDQQYISDIVCDVLEGLVA